MYDNLSVLIDKFLIDQCHIVLIHICSWYRVQGPGCTGMGPGIRFGARSLSEDWLAYFLFHNAHVNITKAQDHVGVTKNSIFDVPGVGNKHFSGFKNDFNVFFS